MCWSCAYCSRVTLHPTQTLTEEADAADRTKGAREATSLANPRANARAACIHAPQANARAACIHAPTPAILGISLSTPDITQLPRHLCHRGKSGVRTDILPRSVETSTLDSLADTTR